MSALMKQKSNGFTDKNALMYCHSYLSLEIDLYIAYENVIPQILIVCGLEDMRTEPCLSLSFSLLHNAIKPRLSFQ